MPAIVVEVSSEIADYWEQLAEREALPVGLWLGLCGFWGAALDLPISRIILRQPPAANALEGVAWEVGEFPLLTCPPHRPTQGESAMINKVILVGNLGRDPEIRSTTSGTPVANLSVATSRKWNDADGNLQEQTEWHRVVVFGRQAEIAGKYLSRGRQIYVEGRLQTRSWEDRQTGETRYMTEVVCEVFKMLGQPSDGDGSSQSDTPQGSPPTDDGERKPEDDDIPF